MAQTERPAVLVTGGAGYIGAHTAKALLGWEPLHSDLDQIVRDALRGEGQPAYGAGARGANGSRKGGG